MYNWHLRLLLLDVVVLVVLHHALAGDNLCDLLLLRLSPICAHCHIGIHSCLTCSTW